MMNKTKFKHIALIVTTPDDSISVNKNSDGSFYFSESGSKSFDNTLDVCNAMIWAMEQEECPSDIEIVKLVEKTSDLKLLEEIEKEEEAFDKEGLEFAHSMAHKKFGN